MGYLWFLLLVLGSFVMASEEFPTVGEVRILGAKPASVDSITGKRVSGSDDLVLKIKQVSQDRNTGSVSLVVAEEGPYEVMQVIFDKVQYKDLSSIRLKNYLLKNEGFVAVVNAKDLELDTSRFVSTLFVSAKNVTVRAPEASTTVSLDNILCDYKNVRSLPWTEEELVRINCL